MRLHEPIQKQSLRPNFMRQRWYVLTGLCVLVLSLLLHNPVGVVGQAAGVTYNNPLAYIGPDGNYYVTSLEGPTITVIASHTTFESDEDTGPKHYGSQPHWSPDGKHLAFIDSNAPFVNALYVAESGKLPHWVTSDHDLQNSAFSWSPDGKLIAIALGFGSGGLQIFQSDGTLVQK